MQIINTLSQLCKKLLLLRAQFTCIDAFTSKNINTFFDVYLQFS